VLLVCCWICVGCGGGSSSAAIPNGVLRVTVPANTPPEDIIFMQLGNQAYPMMPLGGNVWELAAPEGGYTFAYTRGLLYSGGEFLPGDPGQKDWNNGRSFAVPGPGRADVVTRWRWMPPDGTTLPTLPSAVTTVMPRLGGAELAIGVELEDSWNYWYAPNVPTTAAHLAAIGMTWVELAPPWDYTKVDPLPVIAYSTNHAQYDDAALRDETMAFRSAGVNVVYRVQVCCTSVGDTTAKSTAWWDAWFATYQAFLVHHAEIAAATGVKQFLLDGFLGGVQSSLPGSPGSPGAPADAEARWRKLMAAVRAAYSGQIGFGLLIANEAGSYALPGGFTQLATIGDLFDYYGWRMAQHLTTKVDASQAELDDAVEKTFVAAADAMYAASPKPQVITDVQYASFDGAAMNEVGVDEIVFVTGGAESASTRAYDGLEQAMVFQSILAAIAKRPFVIGMYAFNAKYVALPTAPDFSVRGKAAEKVMTDWIAKARP
jgi:hypothetical protein